MNKTEFIERLKEKTDFSKKDCSVALEAVLDTITESLKKEESVAFIGFGTFTTAVRKPRVAINPSTKEKIKIDEKKVVKFKVGKTLKDSVAK